MKVTYRNPKQERLDFRESFKKKQKNSMNLFYQKTKTLKPWAVGIVNEYGKITVIIYHEELRRGYVQFTRLYFDNALSIVAFVKSIINAHTALGYNMSFNGQDIADLYRNVREVINE